MLFRSADKGWSRIGTAAEAKSDFNSLLNRLEKVDKGGKKVLQLKPEQTAQQELGL